MNYIPATTFCESVRDGTHDTPRPTSNGYKLVTGKHIKNGCIDTSDAYFISEDDYVSINRRSLVEKWDVLMSMIGTVGEVAVVRDIPHYAIKNIALFKCNGSELKGKWLSYYLKSPEAIGHMRGNSKGASQQFLSLGQLRDLPIPDVSESLMQKTVDILSAYDDLIENNKKQIKLLEEAAQRLYKEWFIDLRFPGYEHTKIVNGIPEGWKKGKAEDFFSITIGKTPPRIEPWWFTCSPKGQSWLSIADMGGENVYSLSTSECLTDEAIQRHHIKMSPPGTILLSFKLTVGRVAIAGIPLCSNEAIAHFHITEDETREYLYCYLRKYNYDSLGSTSSISKAINSSIIKSMPMEIPDRRLLSNFSKYTSPLFLQMLAKQQQNEELVVARNLLLQKLMSGEKETIHV